MNPIIILGMHRAGTSLLTKILSQLGVFIGNDIDDNNESLFFCKLNDWAMYQAGATWDNPYNMQFLNKDFNIEIAKNFQKQLKGSSVKKYHSNFKKLIAEKVFFGWKDPRNTFTIDIWHEIFPQTKIIHIYRNPIDIAASLQKREHFFQASRGSQTKSGIKRKFNEKFLINKRIYSQSLRVNDILEGVKLWEQYTSKALSIKGNIIHISYEELLEKPEEIIKQICDFILLKVDDKILKNITQNIDKTRKFAFLEDAKLVEKYNLIINNELVRKLGYNNIK